MNTKHTPGPWIIESSNKILWIWSGGNNGTNIPEIVVHINDDKDYKSDVKEKILANAKLIAAAPELLDACEDMLLLIKLNNNDIIEVDKEELAKWKAIIKKATK